MRGEDHLRAEGEKLDVQVTSVFENNHSMQEVLGFCSSVLIML